ncbi:UDP-glucuronic acid decarboxylase family protein [Meiothermus hypogaeus]|uniref:UDP-glucuronate decarboxylase n=2 Tax=Meiothermus hypogaeus TaxID=884155 RepID=A0A511R1K0_9DEIN|nr:UDP-glucuronic acid decarboxylase family protein [Meiothermus hypogaeus]RIH76853.1 UDP-glucose 4-epimerase [Meiothermus hypogaeus]GEM83167.1 epimerase [Meiothermus hypogaeus NBRC 106114]
MRILITGAAGFLGSHLSERLLLEGHQVIGVDDFSSGQPRNIELLSQHAQFHFVQADASKPLQIAGPLDWVMHFASPASPPRYLKLPIQTLLVNGEGTRHLLDLAVEKGARFFLASTSEVYGDPLVHPQPETYWGNVNPVGPRSIYDEGKRYAETLTVAYQQAKGVSTRIIRIFNTYGPRMDAEDGRVVTNFISQALRGLPLTIYGDGSQTRSFQYVDDLIEGIRRLMEVEYHQPVNLGNPEEYTMLQLAELIQELVGSRMPLEHKPLPQDDPRQRRPDISRAKALLGWEPRVPVREGLARTIAYFRDLQCADWHPEARS